MAKVAGGGMLGTTTPGLDGGGMLGPTEGGGGGMLGPTEGFGGGMLGPTEGGGGGILGPTEGGGGGILGPATRLRLGGGMMNSLELLSSPPNDVCTIGGGGMDESPITTTSSILCS
jgi:hypothetical protein